MRSSRNRACFCLAKGRPNDSGGSALGAPTTQDLTSLKTSELQRRALAAGLDQASIDEALEQPQPKVALAAIILAREGPAGEDTAEAAAFRSQLEGLRLTELRKRAEQTGVSEEDMDAAVDSDGPKDAVIDLLVKRRQFALDKVSDSDSEAVASLRRELGLLKLSELRRRAISMQVEQEQLEAADDADDIKQSIIELIVHHHTGPVTVATEDRPHFGAKIPVHPRQGDGAAAEIVGTAKAQNNKHVMLSYQWDHQQHVTRVFDLLEKLGCKCWMDIKGGMASDIYASSE